MARNRICIEHGCPAFAQRDGSRCVAHDRKRQHYQQHPRGSSTQQGYGSPWRRYRASFLQANPWCVQCARVGTATPATVVDHIVPHRGDQELFWSPENHQALCKRCHDTKTAREGRWGGAG